MVVQRIIFSCLLCLATSAFAGKSQYLPSEHMTAGDEVKLFFSEQDTGIINYSFNLASNVIASYGEIVALGDFYGVVGKPISLGTTTEERRARFTEGFNAFAVNQTSKDETNKILELMRDEKRLVEEAMKKGEKPEDVYKKISMEQNRQYNCITGGGCSENGWWLQKGRYLNLANENYDHFGNNAWTAYKTGHDVAIEMALEANRTHDIKQLELAYAMNAFASHFLSDRFSSGHIRTPRTELTAHTTPATVGSLLAGYMHNEENQYGLRVHNELNNHWMAFGDDHYFDNVNKENRRILQMALQTSADEIYTAYRSGKWPEERVHAYLPQADEVAGFAKMDISPLFYWDNSSHTLLRRTDTTNVFDRNWTASWWGWSTLAQLSEERGILRASRARLIAEGYSEELQKYGIQ